MRPARTMCWKRIRRTPPKPPSQPPLRHGHGHGHPSSSNISSSAIASSSADVSSISTSSIASLKDMVPDGAIIYRFEEICRATGNFDPSKKVGYSVWKASLRNCPVAISRKLGSARPLSSVLRRVHAFHHSNLVKLLGVCREGEYLFLVYEFMESSSLRDCLRSKHGVNYCVLSSWHSRLQIAVDVAKGLEYLHHLTAAALIHKYIDSRKILVGKDLRAKIGHVGVSALTGEVDFCQEREPEPDAGEMQPASSSQTISRTRSIKLSGIQGYMPPEYLHFGKLSTKYDVFAFGVVLVEILSGKEVAMSEHGRATKTLSLTEAFRTVMAGDDSGIKLRIWMDPLLRDSYPVDDAYEVATIALSCVDDDPSKRPAISETGVRLQKLLASAAKWEAQIKESLTVSLQPR